MPTGNVDSSLNSKSRSAILRGPFEDRNGFRLDKVVTEKSSSVGFHGHAGATASDCKDTLESRGFSEEGH